MSSSVQLIAWPGVSAAIARACCCSEPHSSHVPLSTRLKDAGIVQDSNYFFAASAANNCEKEDVIKSATSAASPGRLR